MDNPEEMTPELLMEQAKKIALSTAVHLINVSGGNSLLSLTALAILIAGLDAQMPDSSTIIMEGVTAISMDMAEAAKIKAQGVKTPAPEVKAQDDPTPKTVH